MRGKVLQTQETSWFDVAARDNSVFSKGLAEIGLGPDDIREGVAAFGAAWREAHDQNLREKWNDGRYRGYLPLGSRGGGGFRRDSLDWERSTRPTEEELREFEQALSGVAHRTDAEYATRLFEDLSLRLQGLLGIVRIVVEDERYDEVKVPMFYLHSPNVPGSEVTYEEVSSEKLANAYKVEFFGNALGATRSIMFSSSVSATSSNGSYKKLFMVVTVKNTLISVIKGGKRINMAVRSELEIEDVPDLEIGIEDVRRDDFQRLKKGGRGKSFRLSGDSSGAILNFKENWKKSEKMEMEIGIDAFNIKSSIKGELEREIELKLEYKLPAGRDYAVKRINNGFGVVWE